MPDSIPQYYKEPVFFSKQFWHPDIHIPVRGDEGNLLPFRASSDDMVVLLLLTVFFVTVTVFVKMLPFLKFQSKYVTFTERGRFRGQANISKEIMLNGIVVVMGCLSLALVSYLWMLQNYPAADLLDKRLVICGVALGLLGYFFVRRLVYLWANNTFLQSNNIKQWNRFSLFVSTSEMILLIPVSYALVFTDVNMHFVLLYVVFVVVSAKFFTFYKQTQIFFRQTGGFLQNILYFCALEMVPLLMGASIATLLLA